MKKIFFAICLIALILSPAYADDTGAVGVKSMTLTDPTGGGPDVAGIAKSLHSYVAYSGAAAAGYTGQTTAGQTMCVVAYSNKAQPEVQLTVGARASNDPDYADDNTIYQLPTDSSTGRTTTEADGYLTGSTVSGWLVRGGS